MAHNTDERQARKAYVRARQKKVFTITGAAILVVLIVAILFFFHIGGLGEAENSADEPNYGVQIPCASSVTSDGKAPTYVDNKSVTVRVLNGTQHAGFATAVANALANREFVIQSVDNYDSSNVERTTIFYGKNAIPEAFTLASNFTDAVLQMDDRSDKLVDLVLGATFDNLKDTADVPKTGSTIENTKGCVPIDQMTDIAKSIEHDAV